MVRSPLDGQVNNHPNEKNDMGENAKVQIGMAVILSANIFKAFTMCHALCYIL